MPSAPLTIDTPGTYAAQLIVNDAHLDSAPDTVSLSTQNAAPVANTGIGQSARAGDTVTLDGSQSSDADGDPLSYFWSLLSQPSGSAAQLDNLTQVAPRFVLDIPGTYIGQLTVNDGALDSAADTVRIDPLNFQPRWLTPAPTRRSTRAIPCNWTAPVPRTPTSIP